MNNQFNQLLTMPLPIIGLAIVMVLLLALTMNAVIKRDRAMIGERRHDSAAQGSYMSRWRDLTAG
jgi:hypothetical protein